MKRKTSWFTPVFAFVLGMGVMFLLGTTPKTMATIGDVRWYSYKLAAANVKLMVNDGVEQEEIDQYIHDAIEWPWTNPPTVQQLCIVAQGDKVNNMYFVKHGAVSKDSKTTWNDPFGDKHFEYSDLTEEGSYVKLPNGEVYKKQYLICFRTFNNVPSFVNGSFHK